MGHVELDDAVAAFKRCQARYKDHRSLEACEAGVEFLEGEVKKRARMSGRKKR